MEEDALGEFLKEATKMSKSEFLKFFAWASTMLGDTETIRSRTQQRLEKQDPLFQNFAEIIKKGKIGKSEFQDFTDAYKIASNDPLIVTSQYKNIPGTSKKPRMAWAQTLSMLPTGRMFFERNANGEIHTYQKRENLTPYFTQATISPHAYISTFQNLPISFLREHVEARFFQRSKKPLSYADPDFFQSLHYALAIIHSIENSFSESNTYLKPIIIPHKKGLFLGHIEHYLTQPFSMNKLTAQKIDGVFKKSAEQMPDNEIWSPQYHISVKTFIGHNEYFQTQRSYYSDLMKILQTHTKEIEKIAAKYFPQAENPVVFSDTDQEKISELKEKLLKFVKSPASEHVLRFGQKYTPEENHELAVMKNFLHMYQGPKY